MQYNEDFHFKTNFSSGVYVWLSSLTLHLVEDILLTEWNELEERNEEDDEEKNARHEKQCEQWWHETNNGSKTISIRTTSALITMFCNNLMLDRQDR